MKQAASRVCCLSMLVAIALPVQPAAAQNARATLDLGKMPWKAIAGGHASSVATTAVPGVIGKYAFNCDGGEEDFPRLGMTNAGPKDWRRFNRLWLKLRLMTDDKAIQAGGKEITVCLYDAKTRHENLPGTPVVQQTVGKFKLAAGDWQTIDLDLADVERSEVQNIEVFLYETPYSYPHRFTIELAGAFLTGPGSDQTCFDSHVYGAGALRGASGDAAGSIRTTDGLELRLGGQGGIAEWSIDGKPLGDGRKQASGILLRDATAGAAPVMAGGKIAFHEGRAVQTATLNEAALKLDAEYVAQGDRIAVNGTVGSLRPADRAVTVYVAVPLAPAAWRWDKGPTKSSEPFGDVAAAACIEEKLSDYPLCALNAPNVAGLTLAVRLDRPAVYRFVVNPAERLLYVAFDFALVDGRRADGQPMSSAEFSVVVYRHDPQWGFRSALARYYKFFPEFFTDRVGRGGGWDIGSHRAKDAQTPEQYASGGYRFDWGAAQSNAKWNHEHGVLNLLYIEPEFLQFSMGDEKTPSTAQTSKRLAALSQGDDAQWSKFDKLHYTRANCGHPWSKQYSGLERRPFLTCLLNAALKSGIYDAEGKPVLGLGYRPGWIGDTGFGAMIPCNLNPKIPQGKGSVNNERCLAPVIKETEAATGVPVDGFALDCFVSAPNDFRRDNFKYSSYPLSFDARTKRPMIPGSFSSVEWLKWMGDIYRPRKMAFMANIFGPITFAAPHVDIFGKESPYVPQPELLRTLAYRRPITYLPYVNQPKTEVEYNLLWGIYPGRGIDLAVLAPMIPVLDKLYAAGWEPVTQARATPESVRVERFGGGASCYLSLHNPAAKAEKVQVRVDWKALAIAAGTARMEYPKPLELPRTADGFEVNLEPRQTVVVRLQ